MMNPWNELNEETTAVDIGDRFHKKLGEYRY